MAPSARTPRSPRRRMESGAIIKNTPRPSNPRSTRPKKRSIVRWSAKHMQNTVTTTSPPKKDTLNNKLLLSIQSACNSLAIKLPWQEIAGLMGGSISDSAIVQHLTKLRARMEESGASVPPPLKRGVGFSRTGRGTSDGTASATATASCSSRSKGGRGTTPSSTKVKVEVGENEEWSGDSSDDEREDDDRVGASSFKRNDIDEYNRSDHDNGQYSRKAKSHTTLSASASMSACSGTSPRLRSKIVKVGMRGATGQGIGGNRGGLGGGATKNTTVDVLGQKFSGHNISSASSQTVYSPDFSADLQVDAGGNLQPVIGESTVTTGHLPHQYQDGWTESARGAQHSPAVDGLRQGGQVGENEEWSGDSSDDEREDDDRVGASSFKRNDIDEYNRSDHDNGQYVSAGASFLHFPVDTGLTSYYSSRKAKSHTTLSASASMSACSGTSPRLRSKIVKVGMRGATGQGIGGNRGGLGGGATKNTTVDVLGQKFSGHNISSASSQTVYSPDFSADLQVDAGGNLQPVIGESTVTTGHLPHQYQDGWTESARGAQHSPAVDGLRQGGQGRYGNHNTNPGAGYQQHTSHFNMASNTGIPHHGTNTNPFLPSGGYQETGNRFQNSDMPPPPAPQHNSPISPRDPHHYVDGMGMGALENIAGGLWHNNAHPHPHPHPHACRPSPNNPTCHTDPFVRRGTSSASIITSTTTADTGTEADTITPAILDQLPSMQELDSFGGSLADALLDDMDDMFAPLREAWVDGSW
ncbi:hypothetical protein PABG_12564 [Paracoccidioides brasiliensis Pb03]|nr:hypothetical protein PABG_12564 [Paracoccidioides brasiliensis Pb03]